MTCSSCGANLPDGTTTCSQCGAAVPPGRRCPHCQALIPINSVVCPVCEELIHTSVTSPAPHEDILEKSEYEILSAISSKPKTGFRWVYLVAAVTIFALGFMIGSITTIRTLPESATGKGGAGQSDGPANLDGLWKQVNSTASTSYQAAGISGDTIEIMWVDTETDTQSLYWAGTVELPEDPGSEFTWESVRDTAKMSSAMTASSDDTKAFTYRDGQLRFNASVMGTTSLIRMEKVSDTPPDMSTASESSSEPPMSAREQTPTSSASSVLSE